MKQNWAHFWYCTSIIVIATAFPLLANQESYSIVTSGATNSQSSLDATLDSFKASTTRALKVSDQKTTPSTEAEDAHEIPADPTQKKKGWFRTKIASWFDPKNQKKTLRNMNFDELEAFKQRSLEVGDRYNAIRILERMVPICTDLTKLKDILLELADLLFDDGKLESAGKMYREFVKYYPGNAKVEYALYKAVVCKFYTTLDPQRDQTNTRETIELANKFLEREEIFVTHSQEVTTIRTQCYQRLFDSEINIFDFYCSRNRHKSAKTRLNNIRKEFIELIPTCEPYLISREIELAQKVNDAPFLAEKQKELAEKFPDYQATLVVEKNSKKKNKTDRA